MINSRRTLSSQIKTASSKKKIANPVYFDKIPQTQNMWKLYLQIVTKKKYA